MSAQTMYERDAIATQLGSNQVTRRQLPVRNYPKAALRDNSGTGAPCASSSDNYQSGQTYVLRIESALCSQAFFDTACYEFYQVRLLNRARPLNIQLHAYCLLSETVYLMMTPMTPTGLHELLDSLNESYSEYFNLRFQRRRKVWQARTRLHPLPDNAICLDFQKYIERLPVDQNNHVHPGTHPWSSYSRYAFDRVDSHLTMHPRFQRFRRMTGNPMGRYRDFIASPFNEQYRQSLADTFCK